MKTPGVAGSALDAKHLDAQFRPRAVVAFMHARDAPSRGQRGVMHPGAAHATAMPPRPRFAEAEHHHAAEEGLDHREHGHARRID